MKALLITTVEREAQETMGQEPVTINRSMVIPWKEIASIDISDNNKNPLNTDIPIATIHRIDAESLQVLSFIPFDMSERDCLTVIEAAIKKQVGLK